MLSEVSISGSFGVVHVSVIEILRRKSYKEARQWMRFFGFTKSEQNELLWVAKHVPEPGDRKGNTNTSQGGPD